jgi:hypothetical protein
VPSLKCRTVLTTAYAAGLRVSEVVALRVADGAVRAVLYEAANIILSRVVRFSLIKAWAMCLAKRSNIKKAKVALARKLAVLMHRIWLEGTTFDWQHGTKTPAR